MCKLFLHNIIGTLFLIDVKSREKFLRLAQPFCSMHARSKNFIIFQTFIYRYISS